MNISLERKLDFVASTKKTVKAYSKNAFLKYGLKSWQVVRISRK